MSNNDETFQSSKYNIRQAEAIERAKQVFLTKANGIIKVSCDPR